MSLSERPRPLAPRVLALALAVGLGGLLVGLSVAPSTLPGDTLHVTPRSAAGATVAVSIDGAHVTPPSFGDAAHPFLASVLAVVPVASRLDSGGRTASRAGLPATPVAGRAPLAARVRGPPAIQAL